MAKTKEQKGVILRDLEKKIEKANSVVFAKFGPLTVKENEDLRNKLREENSEFYVSKKTLLGIAFKDKKIENLDIKNFEGRIAAIFGYEDEVAPAKVVDNFRKDHEEKIDFICGVLENKYIDGASVGALAKLPSKQELYAKMVGSLNAPVSGFVNALAGNVRGLVNVLKAIEEKKA